MKFKFIKYLLLISACHQGIDSSKTKEMPWQEKNKDIISASLPEKNIYQIKVLQQKSEECSMHQDRNLLFSMAMFADEQKNFITEYNRMISEDLFEKLASQVECPIIKGARRNPEIRTFLNKYPSDELLPKNSLTYLDKITHYDNPNLDMEHKAFKSFKQSLATIEPKLNITEDLIKNMWALSIGNYSSYSKLIQEIENLATQDDYQIPIALHLNSIGTHRHAVSLLVRKSAGKIEYIFMDPLNWDFLGNENYKYALLTLRNFIEDKTMLKKSLIRRSFSWIFRLKDSVHKDLIYSLLGVNENLKVLHLLKDEFYIEYYKYPICKIIKDNIKEDYEFGDPRYKDKNIKKELINLYSCP